MNGFGAGVDPMAGFAASNIPAHQQLAAAFEMDGINVSIVGSDALDEEEP